ncbi:Uma2 family endonuclease [Streptomyces sp. CA-181903]|uniref:Uma2 family endonuclease n=1 Tax=Streptomyces sp. CA-181903 TaxID=3240055 RepID=UPI003D8F4E35
MGAVTTAGRQDRPATADNWAFPPPDGWTVDQVADLWLPFAWELVDGLIAPRGLMVPWHNLVRQGIHRHLADVAPRTLAVLSREWVPVDERNVAAPDVIVVDRSGLDLMEDAEIPARNAVLMVEVVAPCSRQDDRVRKPALYASAGVKNYWCVERGEDGMPEVHEFWLRKETGQYVSAFDRPVHTGKLETDRPFPVVIDLASLVEL